jgi:hypothetical protein
MDAYGVELDDDRCGGAKGVAVAHDFIQTRPWGQRSGGVDLKKDPGSKSMNGNSQELEVDQLSGVAALALKLGDGKATLGGMVAAVGVVAATSVAAKGRVRWRLVPVGRWTMVML